MLARCGEGTHWRREKHDSGAHGRDEHCPRIFNATTVLVAWIRDRVRCIVLLRL